MPGRYELTPAAGGRFMWTLRAANSEAILASRPYDTKEGAERGILACRANSPFDERYLRKTTIGNMSYFVLTANNHEQIGTSEMYATVAARLSGIDSCKRHGPTAEVVDHT